MKPFHYHEDPMYAAAAAILAGQTVSEEATQLDEGVEQITDIVANLKKGDKTNFGVVTDVGQHSISFKAKDLPVTKIAFNQRKIGSKDFVLDKLVKLKEDVSLEEGSMDSMSLEQLWDKHEEYSYAADQGYGTGKGSAGGGKAAAEAIFKFVKSKFGDKVADDMLDSSNAYVSDAEYDDTSKSKNERKAIRKKHGMNEGYDMGTATITAPGNKLHGKQVSIFHKFDDGRLNVQYAKSVKKGDVLNLTLQKDQYKLD